MISATNPGPMKPTGSGVKPKVIQLPSMPPRPYTPGKSGPFVPGPKPGSGVTHKRRADMLKRLQKSGGKLSKMDKSKIQAGAKNFKNKKFKQRPMKKIG